MTVILGPVLAGTETRKVTDKATGRTFYRKQILPEGKFDYKGTELDLGPEKLQTYVQSFKEGAFDEVPFQFGGSESEHNNDPMRRGGTLAHMEHVPGKGVFGYFDFSKDPQSAQYVEKYPRFGVSPRIELGIKRADGKAFDGAIQHVCGTLVPRINGMDPWEKVELSNGANTEDEVINLSTGVFEDEKVIDPGFDFIDDRPVGETKMPELSQEQLDALNSYMEERKMIEDLASDPVVLSLGEKATPPVQQVQQVAPVDEVARKAVEDMRRDMAREKWEAKKEVLLSQGVPPAAIAMAEPVMLQPEDNAIELSSGGKTTDKERMLGLLDSMKGTVDLSNEVGHQVGALGAEEKEDLNGWIDFLGLGSSQVQMPQ
jgi:hypothetical protein